MRLIRWCVKMVLLPVVFVLMLIQWIGIFLNSISGVIMGILSFLFASTAMASLIFGLVSEAEIMKMMAVALVIFLIPHIGNWLIERIVLLRRVIGDYIRS